MCRSLMYCVRCGWSLSTRGIHHACTSHKHLLVKSESERLLWPLSWVEGLSFRWFPNSSTCMQVSLKMDTPHAALEAPTFSANSNSTRMAAQYRTCRTAARRSIISKPWKRGIAVREEHFHVEQSLVLAVVSAYNLSQAVKVVAV
jgi:hypothetical protein